MVIYCPADGTAHPDFANFCMKCGQPLRAAAPAVTPAATAPPAPGAPPATTAHPARWEYREVTIPLHAFAGTLHAAVQLATSRYETALAEQLAQAAAEGWEPDGPTDWDSLVTAGRVKAHIPPTLRPPLGFESVTIRLKRLVPA